VTCILSIVRFPISARRLHLPLLVISLFTLAFAGGAFWEGMLTAWSDLLSGTRLLKMLAAGLPYAFCVFLILGAHEMGHYLACRYYRIPATLPFFIPGPPPLGSFGAIIRIRGLIPHRKALFDIAAAGPIAGFTIALPLLLAGVITAEPFSPGEQFQSGLGPPALLFFIGPLLNSGEAFQANSLFGAGWVGMLVTSLNLFPVGQLDGGHAAYALSRRLHRLSTRTALIALIVLMSAQGLLLAQFPSYFLWFLILLWMRDRHPRLLDESGQLGPGRKLIALLLLLIFLLSFIPVPFVLGAG
jgi:membrane-associated protease RseP (regulator of RpoE activity)